jgi:peptidoglycan/LPS O-acetylase OafA/YrhL
VGLNIVGSKLATNRIEGLDLLRFGAAFCVLLYHYFFIGPLQGYWPNTQFVNLFHFGDFGVDVFFVISGLVISLSADGRTCGNFIKARFIRIMPAYFVCSLFTAITSSLLPGVSPSNIFTRWVATLTFYPQLFKQELVSGVYWTLQLEIKFYIIVAILLLANLWRKYALLIFVPLWLLISLVNVFYLNNSVLGQLLSTEYAGHFAAGMLLYQMRKGEQNSFTPLGFLLSGILMWKHCVGFESWIGGSFNYSYTEIGTFLIAPVCIALVYYVSRVNTVPIPSKILTVLGGMSYTLYLIHADFGFFLRAMSDRMVFIKYPAMAEILTNKVIVSMAIFSSLVISMLVVIYCEPLIKALLKKILNRKQSSPLAAQTGV